MNDDEFESHLRQQPLREVPPAWRRDILRECHQAADAAHATAAAPRVAWAAVWLRFLTALRTPQSVLPWAGLAAVWLVILALNHNQREESPAVLAQAAPVSPQIVLALREQNKMFAELLAVPPHEADRPKAGMPRPRSECHPLFLTV